MGQKTNPIGFRIAVTKDWRSKWYADKKEFGKLFNEDRQIREILKKKLEQASVPKIQIERAATRCRITIFTARPGVVIGRKGAEIDKMKEDLSKLTGKVFRIGHLGACNDLILMGALNGVEIGLGLAGVPHRTGGAEAARQYLSNIARESGAKELGAAAQ